LHSKAEKTNSMTRIKIKVFGNSLRFIGKYQKDKSRDTGTGIWYCWRILENNSGNVSSPNDGNKQVFLFQLKDYKSCGNAFKCIFNSNNNQHVTWWKCN